MKQLAQTFKALSDETRLRILALLTQGELCVCDLMAVLKLPQSTVSRHLAYLRHTDIITDRREGVWMHYSLNRQLKIIHEDTWRQLLDEVLEQKQSVIDLAALKLYLAQKSDFCCR